MASRGGSHSLFADHGWDSPKQLKGKLIFVPLWRKCEWSLDKLLGKPNPRFKQKETVLGQQCFWCSYTHTLVLSYYYTWFTVKGPLLPLHGAVIYRAEGGASFCRHLVTTEPASQSGRPVVAALSLGSTTGSFWGAFLQFIGAKRFGLKLSTLYRAEKAQSFGALFVTHSQSKQ